MTARYARDQPDGFSNRIEKVAIVGAGGHVGRHLTEPLLKTGKHVVTAIARPNSTSKLPDGVRVARVDSSGDDDAELVQALQGQQALIVTMAVAAPRGTVSKFVRAAAKAGVPYILPNWFGHDAANDALCRDSLLSEGRDQICAEVEELGPRRGADRFGFDFKKRSLVWLDDGDVAIHTSTWPRCGAAIASLMSLKELPDNEADQSPTLSQFRNGSVYISSFKLTQRDMFESVKRVTGTADADWTSTRESTEARWKDGRAALKQGNWGAFTKMLYSRMFFPTGDAEYKSGRGLDNDTLGLEVEDLDRFTAIAVSLAENGEVQGH